MIVSSALRWSLRGLGAVVLAYGVYWAVLMAGGNFHAVVPGQVYRAAQPSAKDIAAYQQSYGIRSIINLRGASAGRAWYEDEVAEAAKRGIVHIDFRMSSSKLQSPERMEKLIALLKDAPKPLLIHCAWGADRTGLASALYLADVGKAPEAQAEGQLSIAFGHFALPFLSRAYPMDESFEQMEDRFGYPKSVWDHITSIGTTGEDAAGVAPLAG
ncbi:dual specificity protein phosphatase family protein [Rhizobium rhizosphaerae]|uniref:dual specificity protein phosphatase family protein n=1 Tax=Xaviernesmea rhizosphaerae TaxID=1672749 RepID=UPI001FDA16EA|nr:dual specificity protein phosphatase family protein [Xaviernesmea rhizosphaerae]